MLPKTKKEGFTNIGDNHVETFATNKCKEKEELYNKLLTTPVAVNIPTPEYDNTFYVGDILNDNQGKININSNGSYCFPIKQFKYDNVWNGIKKTKNDIQHINWNLNKTDILDNVYCSNKMISKPEKELEPGEYIKYLYTFDNEPPQMKDYNGTAFNKLNLCDYEDNVNYL